MAIKLSRNSWHYKLQTDIFGPRPTFHNFCPYFWITIFCLFAALVYYPVIGVKHFFSVWLPPRAEKAAAAATPAFKWLGVVFEVVVGFLIDVLDNYLCEPLERHTLAHVSDSKLMELYKHSGDYWAKAYNLADRELGLNYLMNRAYGYDDRIKFEAKDKQFQKWKELAGPEWEKKLADAAERQAALAKAEKEREAAESAAKYEREKAAAAAEAARRQMLNNIVKYTQYAVKGVGILLLSGLAVGLIKGLMAVPWLYVGAALLAIPLTLWGALVVIWTVKWKILGVLALIAFSLLAAVLIAMLIKKCDCDIDLEPVLFPIARWVQWFVVTMASPFVSFGRFVADYAVAFKQNNCPQIEWE